MNYTFSKGTNSYKDAVRATESIKPPALGFVKPSDYPSTIANNTAIIKQNNVQIQLLVQISESLKEIRSDLQTILEHQKKGAEGIFPVIPESIITKLSNLSLGASEKPKESKGKLLVFKDHLKILKEEKDKLKR